MDHYILDEQGNPVPEPDVLKWAAWFQDNRRVLKHDRFGRVLVSTVFLGLDHSFSFEENEVKEPVLWESMIFKGKHADTQERYTSQRAALEGHQQLVMTVLSDLSWWDKWTRPEWLLKWTSKAERWLWRWRMRRFTRGMQRLLRRQREPKPNVWGWPWLLVYFASYFSMVGAGWLLLGVHHWPWYWQVAGCIPTSLMCCEVATWLTSKREGDSDEGGKG